MNTTQGNALKWTKAPRQRDQSQKPLPGGNRDLNSCMTPTRRLCAAHCKR